MRIVRTARLWFKEGTSDKLYDVDLLENDALSFPFGERLPEREQLGEAIGYRGVVLVVAILGPSVEAEAGQRQLSVRGAQEDTVRACEPARGRPRRF